MPWTGPSVGVMCILYVHMCMSMCRPLCCARCDTLSLTLLACLLFVVRSTRTPSTRWIGAVAPIASTLLATWATAARSLTQSRMARRSTHHSSMIATQPSCKVCGAPRYQSRRHLLLRLRQRRPLPPRLPPSPLPPTPPPRGRARPRALQQRTWRPPSRAEPRPRPPCSASRSATSRAGARAAIAT